MSAYIKRKSDGVILNSCSSQTVSSPTDLAGLHSFITSRGLSVSDYTFADGTQSELQALMGEAKTSAENANDEIQRLESTVTSRRIREMTTVAGAKWIDDLEKLIAIERAKL